MLVFQNYILGCQDGIVFGQNACWLAGIVAWSASMAACSASKAVWPILVGQNGILVGRTGTPVGQNGLECRFGMSKLHPGKPKWCYGGVLGS